MWVVLGCAMAALWMMMYDEWVLLKMYYSQENMPLTLHYVNHTANNSNEKKNQTSKKQEVNVVSDPHDTRTNKTTTPDWILPNVLLAGVQKSGTTAVFEYLRRTFGSRNTSTPTHDHPLCIARILPGMRHYQNKEPHFFNDVSFRKGVSYYSSLYEHCQPQSPSPEFTPLILDATPNSFTRADRIAHFYKTHATPEQFRSLKILIILREPVRRELSWYHHMERDIKKHLQKHLPDQALPTYVRSLRRPNTTDSKNETTIAPSLITFEERMNQSILPTLINGRGPNRDFYSVYARWVKEWFLHFDRSQQILLLSYDELKTNPQRFVERLHAFLQQPPPKEESTGSSRNRAVVPPANSIHAKDQDMPSCELQKKWYDIFEPYSQEFYKLLNASSGPPMEQSPFPPFRFRCAT